MSSTSTAILTVLLFIAYRLIFRLFTGTQQNYFATDQWYHRVVTKAIRENRHVPPDEIAGYDSPRLAYPWLLHWIFSFLPEERAFRVGSYFGLFVDSLVLLGTQWLAISLLGARLAAGDLSWILWLNFIVMAVSPLLNRFILGKYDFRARPLGVIIVIASLLILSGFAITGSWTAYAAAMLVGSLVFIGSKFGAQAFVGITLITGLLAGSLWLALFPVLTLLLSILLFRGWPLRILHSQVRHLYLYWNDLYDAWPEVKFRGSLRHWREKIKQDGFLRWAYNIYNTNPWLILLISQPFIVIFLLLRQSSEALLDPLAFQFLWGWWLASLFLFALTSIWRFKVFGQAERYLEYGNVPYVLLVSLYLSGGLLWWHYAVLAVSLVLTTANAFIVKVRRLNQDLPYEQVMASLEWLQDQEQSSKVLPIPLNWAHIGIYHTHHTYVSNGFVGLMEHRQKIDNRQHFRRIFSNYPFPSKDLDALIDYEGVDLAWRLKSVPDEGYGFSKYKVVYENPTVVIYQVSKQA